MVAYSFRPRFVDPILMGLKQQTIRADRIGRSICKSVSPITISIVENWATVDGGVAQHRLTGRALERFATLDGFADWAEMKAFWRTEHPGVEVFEGVLIRWGDLQQ